MKTSFLRKLIQEILLEDDARRSQAASVARKIVDTTPRMDLRSLGRELKTLWQAEADISSFNRVAFIHWSSLQNVITLLASPRGKDEIPTFPHPKTPWLPFSLGYEFPVGVIVKGRPTLVANADLNSNAFRRSEAHMGGDFIKQRSASSGWNRYPGVKSPGSTAEETGEIDASKLARSWEEHLVFSADDIVPAEKVNFNARDVLSSGGRKGWPEALVDNWRAEGVVLPKKTISHFGIDEILDALAGAGVPDGIPVYDEDGDERTVTR